jgi:hypothetical protein
MGDAGPFGHAAEQQALPWCCDARFRPVDEGLVDIMRRHGGGDGIQVGNRLVHASSHLRRAGRIIINVR